MPLASPATPARNRRARLASQPHLAWVFALQGANQNLSAFSIAGLNVARIPRDSSEKLPCPTCIPAAFGLGFCPPGCEPKPVRFFNPSLNVARIPRDASEKSPCPTCIPAAFGLGFCPPGCEPKPVRFFPPARRRH